MKKTVVSSFLILIMLVVNSCSNQNSKSLEAKNSIQADSLFNYITFDDYNTNLTEDKSSNGFRDFEIYKESFDTLLIDKTIYYIVEGDLLLDIDELKMQFYKVNRPNDNRKLVGITRDGKIIRIENPTNIRYSIIKETFSDKEYKDIIDYMNEATTNWKNVCNVNFVHNSELDSKLRATENPDEVTFVIRKIGYSSNGLLASAFFPYAPKNERKVFITPSFFRTTNFNKAGILTHEIGHILGFRHEHIRSGAPALCPRENTDSTIDLTQYDPQSVMHYFCGGAGTRDLKLTAIDSIGASIIYK